MIILGGIFGGFVTATEAAGLAVVVALGLGIYYREVNFKRLRSAMVEGGMQTAVVMLLVAASVLMGGFLTRAQIPQELAQSLMAMTDNKYVILGILNIFFLVIGFTLLLELQFLRHRYHLGNYRKQTFSIRTFDLRIKIMDEEHRNSRYIGA